MPSSVSLETSSISGRGGKSCQSRAICVLHGTSSKKLVFDRMWTHVKMATVTFRAKHVAQSDVRAWLHLGRGTTLLLTFISVFVEPDACLPKMARLTALGCTGVSTCSNIWVLCDLLLIFSANCNDQRGPVDLLWISSKELAGAKTATEHTHIQTLTHRHSTEI